ncbi:MAG TPA: Ig-like domain-containing protein [Candidatus Nanopelagicaceae bacterium]|nr:Ig-like domain-containing protein [Candidatus Nanopelagicaceae bacterium]
MDETAKVQSRWPRRRWLVAGSTALVILGGAGATAIVAASSGSPPVAPQVAISVPTGSVSPSAMIGIHLSHARVEKLVVTTSTGAVVAGRLVPGGWVAVAPLPWATKFDLTLRARGGNPVRTVVKTATWVTGAAPLPTKSLAVTISPNQGAQVGMGAAWVIQFPQPIPQSVQAQILQRLATTESLPDPVGWHWWSSTEVDGRPQQFWPLNEQASLSVNLDGLVLGGYRLVNSSVTSNFTVVNQHLTKVSAITHEEQVFNGGQLVNTFPVSLGRAGFPTISGTLVVLYKTPVVFMNSATIGYPGLYAQNVYEDVAISTDGYYMHSANWDIYDHGVANVSHGCVEQNPADAAWFYNWSVPGDVVEITGTTLPATEVNGEGDWNLPWSQFQPA